MCRTVDENYDWACRMARRWYRSEYEDNLSLLLEGLWVFDRKGFDGNPKAFAVSFAKRRRVDEAKASHAKKRFPSTPVGTLPDPDLLPGEHRDFRVIEALEEIERAVARFPVAGPIVEVMFREGVPQTRAAEIIGMHPTLSTRRMRQLRFANRDRAEMILGRERGGSGV